MRRFLLLLMLVPLSINAYGQAPAPAPHLHPDRRSSIDARPAMSAHAVTGRIGRNGGGAGLRAGGDQRPSVRRGTEQDIHLHGRPGAGQCVPVVVYRGWSGAAPSAPSGTDAPPPPPPSLERDFRGYERTLVQLSGQVLGLQAANRTAAATLDASLRSLKDQVVLSDDMSLIAGAPE